MPADAARERLGFLGGSFDPPHFGHLAIARAAQERFGLDAVLLAPTGLQPFKRDGAHASFADRLEMARLLATEEPRHLRASALDGPREDGAPNYAVEFVERLRADAPGAELFGILGADSFLEFPRWHEAERLRSMAQWIVVSRPGVKLPGRAEGDARIHELGGVAVPLASRDLRERLRCGESCAGEVPEAVLRYIRARGLYGASCAGAAEGD